MITLENRTAMMAKAIIPILKDFKQQINNTNDRLTRQYRMMTRAHERYNRLFRQTHKIFQIHHLALLMFNDYIMILVGTLQRIHRQYVRYESALDDTLIGIEHLNSGYRTHRILDPKILAKYLEVIEDDLEETAPEFKLVFTNVYQYYGNSLISFTNTIDDLLLQLPILIKLKVQDISILEEDNLQIYAHLDNVLVHMIDNQQTAIFKSNQDFNKNKEKILQYIKYAENWQVTSVMCSYTVIACDVLLIVAMIVFLLKYHKTMQAMLTAFLQMNTKNTGIQSVQADQIGRTYQLLLTLNLPKEEEIIDDLREITAMEYVVQVIMIIVCIAIVLIVMYFCCTKCRHTRTIFKYCFPFLPISCIVRMSRRTDLFVEVTNVTKGNGIWAHFVSTRYFLHKSNYQD